MIFLTAFLYLVTPDSSYWISRDSLISDVLDFTFNERYAEARTLVDDYIRNFPQDPAGYLLRAALFDYYMLDFSTDRLERQFFLDLNKTERLSQKMLLRAKGNLDTLAWAYFYRGASRAYAAIRRGRKKKIVIALRDGIRALKDLKRALEYKPDLYDAYLALGIYDYAISEIPRYFKWLFFLRKKEDRRQKGLEEIRLAAEKGLYMKIPALDVLAWVLAYQGRTREAASIAERLVEMYPESRSFRWTLAFAHRRGGRWKEAEKVYDEILYLVLRDQIDCPYCIAVSLYWCARTKYYLRKYREASVYADVAYGLLRLVPSSDSKKSLKRSLLRLKKRLRRKLGPGEGREVPDFLRQVLENGG